MAEHDPVFERQRPLLFALAYRMTGMAADAEDILQEAYLRWHQLDDTGIRHPAAYLKTLVARLAVDQLRKRKRQDDYIGTWLPEPLSAEPLDTTHKGPAEDLDLYQSLSYAFLHLLERLTPVQRAVFLLRNVFEFDYREISAVVDKSESNCRQIERRARMELRVEEKRSEPTREEQELYLERFIEAVVLGDDQSLLALLSDQVTLYADGGGKVLAVLRPLTGKQRILEFFRVLRKKLTPGMSLDPCGINGRPGLTIRNQGRVECSVSLDVIDGAIEGIYMVRNPDKLAGLSRSRTRH